MYIWFNVGVDSFFILNNLAIYSIILIILVGIGILVINYWYVYIVIMYIYTNDNLYIMLFDTEYIYISHYIILCLGTAYVFVSLIYILLYYYSFFKKLLQYIVVCICAGFIWAYIIFTFYYWIAPTDIMELILIFLALNIIIVCHINNKYKYERYLFLAGIYILFIAFLCLKFWWDVDLIHVNKYWSLTIGIWCLLIYFVGFNYFYIFINIRFIIYYYNLTFYSRLWLIYAIIFFFSSILFYVKYGYILDFEIILFSTTLYKLLFINLDNFVLYAIIIIFVQCLNITMWVYCLYTCFIYIIYYHIRSVGVYYIICFTIIKYYTEFFFIMLWHYIIYFFLFFILAGISMDLDVRWFRANTVLS